MVVVVEGGKSQGEVRNSSSIAVRHRWSPPPTPPSTTTAVTNAAANANANASTLLLTSTGRPAQRSKL